MAIKFDQGSTRRGLIDVSVSVVAFASLLMRYNEMSPDDFVLAVFSAGAAFRGYIGITHDDSIEGR